MTETPAPSIPGLSFVRKLGAGGYADVYLYEQALPARRVAVKVLRDSNRGRGVAQRFRSEANAMALLEHPHIVPVYATGSTVDGRPYLVMMYYPRASLAERVKAERLSVAEALRVGIQLASAVETAHRAGLLHRDIKPANVLTSQYGTPGLTDFGIAADVAQADDDDAGVSVPWSPPEVLYVTQPASARSDVYSLAATLWHLLVGRSPFEQPGGDNSHYALMKRIRDTPVPDTGRPDVPASLDRLLKAGLAKDPGLRPASAMDFARSLQVIEQELRMPRTEIVVAEEVAAPSGSARGDETRMQGPQLLAAQGVSGDTPPTENLRTRRRTPAVRGVNAPEDATVHRPATSLEHPGLDDGEASGARRWVAWTALLLVVLLAGGVVWALAGGIRPQARPTALPSFSEPPPDPGNTAAPPGRPSIKGVRDGASVTFTWTYANALPSDTFYYRLSPNEQARTVAEPWLKLTGQPTDQQVCIWVRVHRASGADAARSFEKGCVA
ncbi:serine/threonine-protein kinase [Micropruina sp.]|uniref:serine/threonine-protein kinase n=1 Tax=Micropruina sp. TaxID=2737536 RepID=UPI0039E45E25